MGRKEKKREERIEGGGGERKRDGRRVEKRSERGEEKRLALIRWVPLGDRGRTVMMYGGGDVLW